MIRDKTGENKLIWKITLYRGLGLPEKAIEDYEDLIDAKRYGKPKPFAFTGFTSTSYDKEVAKSFAYKAK